MFIKNKLSTGIAVSVLGLLGVITSAQAVHVNKDGTGQVLIYPYYNAQPGYVTNINLINSTDETKAVRIRFREGRNSEDVMDFNLYMSPNDVWTGGVFMDSDTQAAKIITTDRTCTLPTSFAPVCNSSGVCTPGELVFAGGSSVTTADTLEGYVEVIEMGVVDDETVEAGVLHSSGEPNDCSTVSDAWVSGTGLFWNGGGITKPTGGLFGSSAVLNVGEGTAFAIDPVAIDNYSDLPQHTDPFDSLSYMYPSLASGNVNESTIVSNDGEELIATEWIARSGWTCDTDAGELCDHNPYPMAHVLLAPHLMNEYFLDPSSGYDGHTDWVVTFPMKKHGVFDGDDDVQVNFENGVYDREETQLAIEGVSPSSPDVLAREVNVLTYITDDLAYDDSRSVLSSPTAVEIGVGDFVHGWIRMSFGSADSSNAVSYDLSSYVEWGKRFGPYVSSENVSSSDSVYSGVPAVGFAALEGNVSDNANARFGDALPHKIQRDW